MKKLVASNQKGGVGKSAIVCQLSHYLNQLGYRVLVIDFDHQKNTSKALKTGGTITVASANAYDVYTKPVTSLNVYADFMLVEAVSELTGIEKKGEQHNSYATNLIAFLKAMDEHFDICIMDTNPNPDIRQVASLIASDYVISPLQLNQEAIDGIGGLLQQVKAINQKLNPKLKLIGILPNLVEPTPFQKNNLQAIVQHFPQYLIKNENGSYAFIKKTTAIPEAQAQGISVNKISKTTGREAWNHIKPTFDTIINFMELSK
ncbi:ParA family protein [Acinetobacter baumannii]|nr:ParA family protein [Acinetobacter baumannii]